MPHSNMSTPYPKPNVSFLFVMSLATKPLGSDGLLIFESSHFKKYFVGLYLINFGMNFFNAACHLFFGLT